VVAALRGAGYRPAVYQIPIPRSLILRADAPAAMFDPFDGHSQRLEER
jgi:hypothetical protein